MYDSRNSSMKACIFSEGHLAFLESRGSQDNRHTSDIHE